MTTKLFVARRLFNMALHLIAIIFVFIPFSAESVEVQVIERAVLARKLTKHVERKAVALGPLSYYSRDTTGGGDFGFEIKDTGEKYLISVSHYYFKGFAPNEKSFSISKTVAADNRGAEHLGEVGIRALMGGACSYFTVPEPPCPDCATGSWTRYSVTLKGKTEPTEVYGAGVCTNEKEIGQIFSFIDQKLSLKAK